jgi:hypothetical protein
MGKSRQNPNLIFLDPRDVHICDEVYWRAGYEELHKDLTNTVEIQFLQRFCTLRQYKLKIIEIKAFFIACSPNNFNSPLC